MRWRDSTVGLPSGTAAVDGSRTVKVVPWFERARHPDPAAALGHDAVHGRQPQAGALADLLGGEERLEDPRERLLVHALAGVGHHQRHEWVGPTLGAHAGGLPRVASDDADGAAGRHRVPRVDHQVQDRLLDLDRVGPNRSPGTASSRMVSSMFSPITRRSIVSMFDDDLVDVDHSRLKQLAPPERQ